MIRVVPIALLAIALPLAGCNHLSQVPTLNPVRVASPELTFLDRSSFAEAVGSLNEQLGPEPGRFGFDLKKEANIEALCTTAVKAEASTLALSLLLFAGKTAIGIALDQVGKALDAEAKMYVSTYEASAFLSPFYKQVRTASEPAVLRSTCVRLTRHASRDFTAGGHTIKKGQLAMDLIAQVDLTPAGTALRMRPLRLYFGAPGPKKGNVFGLAFKLKVASQWVNGTAGKLDVHLDEAWFKHKVDTTKTQKVFYLYDPGNSKRWVQKRTIVSALPSWSTGATTSGGNLTFSVGVAEAGDVPKSLELLRDTFSAKKDSIGKLLGDALDAHFEPE